MGPLLNLTPCTSWLGMSLSYKMASLIVDITTQFAHRFHLFSKLYLYKENDNLNEKSDD